MIFLSPCRISESLQRSMVFRSTFKTWLGSNKYNDALQAVKNESQSRVKKGKYFQVAEGLVKYIELRRRLYTKDGLGLSWLVLKDRALTIVQSVLSPDDFNNFKASDGFVDKVLKANGLVGVSLHGEAGQINQESAEEDMRKFRTELGNLMETHSIPKERVFNADQTGLFYQKLPNRMYCLEEERRTIRGVKLMRDKNRVTIMVCTSAGGDKVPLSLIGTAKRPQCFDLCDIPPLHYTHQFNAWFDRAVTKWWLDNVFAPFCFKLFGSQKCILLLDNCPAHEGISEWKTQSNIIVKFLPPNLTSAYQPADQGIISSLKLGYKLTLLHTLLDICDDPVAYAAAKTAGTQMKKGCKGISFG